MESLASFTWRLALAVGAVVLAYGPLMQLTNWASSRMLSVFSSERIPFYHARVIWKFPFWFLCVVLLYAALAPLLGAESLWRLFALGLRWSDLVRGLLLGIGEASVAMLLAIYVLRLGEPLRRRQVGDEAKLEFRILGQSGWMRSYKDVFEVVAFPWSYLLAILPLAGEEILFRGLMVPLFLPQGKHLAVVTSTILFMCVQLPRLPSWYQGLAPLSGAAVMGLANGLLFTLKPNLTPLSLAHAVFLGFFLGTSSPGKRSRRGGASIP